MAAATGPDFLSLQVHDLDRSPQFYCTLLGVTPAAISPPGVLVLDSSPVPFALRGHDTDIPSAGKAGLGVVLWLACDDVDELYERVEQAEATILATIADGPFGRAFTITDPDGYRLTLHQAPQ